MVWWKSIETNLLSFSKAEQNPSRLFLTSLKDKFIQLQIFFSPWKFPGETYEKQLTFC